MSIRIGLLGILLGSVNLLSAGAADNADKVAFSTKDVCSASGCTLEFSVKAKGSLAYVELKYVSNAQHVGKADGAIEYMIFDFNTATIKNLNLKNKTYSVGQAGVQNLPLFRMLQELRAKEAKEFRANSTYQGTLYEAKTVTTTIASAEKNAQFKDSDLNVPAGFKRIEEGEGRQNNLLANQPGTPSGASPGMRTPGSGSPAGAPASLPGIGP